MQVVSNHYWRILRVRVSDNNRNKLKETLMFHIVILTVVQTHQNYIRIFLVSNPNKIHNCWVIPKETHPPINRVMNKENKSTQLTNFNRQQINYNPINKHPLHIIIPKTKHSNHLSIIPSQDNSTNHNFLKCLNLLYPVNGSSGIHKNLYYINRSIW